MTENWYHYIKKISLGVVLVSLVFAGISRAQTQGEDNAEKLRQTAIKIGSGKKARVEVRLRDNTRLKGYIASISPDSFTIVEDKSGELRAIPFSDVDRLKKRGGRGAWIAIAALAAAAAVIIGIVAARCQNEPGTCP